MDCKEVDALIEQIIKIEKTPFLINGDEYYSKQIYERIIRKNICKYDGINMLYDLDKMSCTDGCKKTKDNIIVYKNGIVYGPYVDMPAGKYAIEYSYKATNCIVKFYVSANNNELLAEEKFKCNECEGKHTLIIVLDNNKTDVEFKIENYGSEPLIFYKVKAFDITNDYKSFVNEKESIINHIDSLNMEMIAAATDVSETTNCTLPANTRMKFLKRVLRKLIKPYSFFQIKYNERMSRYIGLVNRNVQLMNSEFKRCENNFSYINDDLIRMESETKLLIESEKKLFNNYDKKIETVMSANKKDSDAIHTDIYNLWGVYHSLREELYAEIAYRFRNIKTPINNDNIITPEILDSGRKKLNQNQGAIRLNLGCGNIPLDQYINVDARKLEKVDVVADICNLPFEKGSIDEIYSAHLIEHFTKYQMREEIMPYWYSLLRNGGKIKIVFPDAHAMIEEYNNGERSFDKLSEIIMGGQDYILDYHYAMYSIDSIVNLLKSIGFKEIKILTNAQVNGDCRESEIEAIK